MNRTSSTHIRFLAGAALAAAASSHYVRADLNLTEERICGTCSVHHFASLCLLSTASYSCPDQSFDYCSGSCNQPCPIIYNSGAPPLLKAYVERWTGGHMVSGSRAAIAPIGPVNASAPVCTYTSHQSVDGGGFSPSGSFTTAGINLTVRFQPVPAVYWAARVHVQGHAVPTPQVGGGGYIAWALGGPGGTVADQNSDPQVCTFYGTANNVSELSFSFSGEASIAAQCCGGAPASAVLQTRVEFFIDSAPFTLSPGNPLTTGCMPDLATTDLNSNGIIDANESGSYSTNISYIDESVTRNSSGGASSGSPSCLSHGFRALDDFAVTIPSGDVGKSVTELVFYTAETLGGPDGEFQWNGTVNIALYRADSNGYPIGEGGDGCNPWLELDAANSANAVVTRTFFQPLPNDYFFTDGGCKRYLPGEGGVFEYRIINHPGGLFNIPASPTQTTTWWIGMRPVTASTTAGFSGWYAVQGGGSIIRPYLRPNPNPGSGEPQVCDFQNRPNGPNDLAFSILYGNDVDINGLPDDLQPDCNTNGTYDFLDIVIGSSDDANANGIPDECEPPPCTGTQDCNSNGTPDNCDIAGGTAADCNSNGIPDSCDIDAGTSADCDSNGTPDSCDIAIGVSPDCNTNAVPDECEPDSDGDGLIDPCDNCPAAANPGQTDTDADGRGDACDNCLYQYNPDQADSDGDGRGDACEPVAHFGAAPNPADCNQTIGFNASGSGHGDPARRIVSWEWDLDNDGQFDDATGEVIGHAYPAFGTYLVVLRVTDDDLPSRTDTFSATVNVSLGYGTLASCVSGPGGGIGSGCACADADADGDVDLQDFQTFQKLFTG